MTKTRILITFAFTLLLALPLTAQAFSVKADNSVYIAEDETIEGNLYAAGSNITVDGTVNGDVICGGQTVNINGAVKGDVICGGQTVNINGTVNGSVRVAGNSIIINGTVGQGVQAFGASISLGKKASVGWDMLIAGAIGEIRGKIGGDLHGGVANIVIAGEINKDVRLKLDKNIKKEKRGFSFDADSKKTNPFIITKEAIINGSVNYAAGREGLIEEGAIISGEINYKAMESKTLDKKWWLFGWAGMSLYSIFASLVIGLVLISLWRKQILEITDKMLKKIGPSIGWGAIAMFLTPIISIILCFTIIGIPLAIILMAIWLIAMIVGKILVGILVGRSILSKLWPKKKDSLIWAMIIGIIIVKIVFSIPFVGWILALIAIWWGLGGIWLQFKKS